MNGRMYDGVMMWGMGWWGILLLLLVVLGIGALVKFLFFNNSK